MDLDQVLVNFLGGAKKLLGKEFNDPLLGSDSEKWKLIAAIPNFWKDLDWMPNARLLWDRIKHLNCYILSACPSFEDAPMCPYEKREWCYDHLHVPRDRVIITERKDKRLYATTNGTANLLIDDHQQNCNEWIEAGGQAIHHQNISETLAQLDSMLLNVSRNSVLRLDEV